LVFPHNNAAISLKRSSNWHPCNLESLLLKNLQENRSPGRAKTTVVIQSPDLNKRKQPPITASSDRASNHCPARSLPQAHTRTLPCAWTNAPSPHEMPPSIALLPLATTNHAPSSLSLSPAVAHATASSSSHSLVAQAPRLPRRPHPRSPTPPPPHSLSCPVAASPCHGGAPWDSPLVHDLNFCLCVPRRIWFVPPQRRSLLRTSSFSSPSYPEPSSWCLWPRVAANRSR
jgi:hypothetical protein